MQGGAPSYRHNLMLLEKFGFKPTPVMMRICFGVGDKQWTNHRCVYYTLCRVYLEGFGVGDKQWID